MTGQALIKKLADDCEIPRSRAEDILTAVKDIVVEALKKREPVTLPGLGSFTMLNGAAFKPARFKMSAELRAAVGEVSKIRVERCVKCGNEPPVSGRRKGKKCLVEERRLRRRKSASR